MTDSLLIDTGAFLALADQRDQLHEPALGFYRRLPDSVRRFTTQAVVSETYTFFRYHQGATAATKWLDFLNNARSSGFLAVLYSDADDDARAEAVLRRFPDQRLSYADALLLAAAEKLGIRSVFGFDHHLGLTGLTVLPGQTL